MSSVNLLKERLAGDAVCVAVGTSPAKGTVLLKPELSSAILILHVIREILFIGIGANKILCTGILEKTGGVIISSLDLPVGRFKSAAASVNVYLIIILAKCFDLNGASASHGLRISAGKIRCAHLFAVFLLAP